MSHVGIKKKDQSGKEASKERGKGPQSEELGVFGEELGGFCS